MKHLVLFLFLFGMACMLGACLKDPKAPVEPDEPKQPLVPGSNLCAEEAPVIYYMKGGR